MDEFEREFLEDRILDLIEDEAYKVGLDGCRIADLLSYYLADDPRFITALKKEVLRQALISKKNL